MSPVSRGFRGRRRERVDPARMLPGQYLERDFSVLSGGPTPQTRSEEWSFTIGGAVEQPASWRWEEFVRLPAETIAVEVSPYLVDEPRPGDELELRGPIGGYFVWEQSMGGPLQLVAGGSGIMPLRSMLRHRAASGSSAQARLLYSARALRTRSTGRS